LPGSRVAVAVVAEIGEMAEQRGVMCLGHRFSVPVWPATRSRLPSSLTYVKLDGMSYVDILILRHLYRRPVHGYELRKQVEATTGFVLHNNSLYPALRRFEEAGAVVKTLRPQEGRPPRHVYELTDVARELLQDL